MNDILGTADQASRAARDEVLTALITDHELRGLLQNVLNHLFLFELMELKLNGRTTTAGGHVLIQQGLALPWLHRSQGGPLDGRSFLTLELTNAGHHEFDERMEKLPGNHASDLLRDAVMRFQRDELSVGICATAQRIDQAGAEGDVLFLQQLCDAETGARHFSETDIATLARALQFTPAPQSSYSKTCRKGLINREIRAAPHAKPIGKIIRTGTWLQLTLREKPKSGFLNWFDRNIESVFERAIHEYDRDTFHFQMNESLGGDDGDGL
ncbi:hypothetical protein KUW09_23535 [Mameliella alba]|nr:hypothetical protein [Antarctobacter heliothermus]MBY6147045.1 hypothetical protein [Mameliella alba]MCA0957050.1 hypothetical protein [Mameliella alba]